jgi:hypothetical protein
MEWLAQTAAAVAEVEAMGEAEEPEHRGRVILAEPEVAMAAGVVAGLAQRGQTRELLMLAMVDQAFQVLSLVQP